MAHTFALASRSGLKRDPTARRHALISAATKLFASCGYEAGTMQGIAAGAGCAQGLIHRYFGIIRSVSAECGAYQPAA
jgi:AcrR family transcriptional regulator